VNDGVMKPKTPPRGRGWGGGGGGRKRRLCELGASCPYKHQHQHQGEFHHGEDDAPSNPPRVQAFAGAGQVLGGGDPFAPPPPGQVLGGLVPGALPHGGMFAPLPSVAARPAPAAPTQNSSASLSARRVGTPRDNAPIELISDESDDEVEIVGSRTTAGKAPAQQPHAAAQQPHASHPSRGRGETARAESDDEVEITGSRTVSKRAPARQGGARALGRPEAAAVACKSCGRSITVAADGISLRKCARCIAGL
jgi:hypothetical protein